MGNKSEMAVQRSEGHGKHLLQRIQTIFNRAVWPPPGWWQIVPGESGMF